MTTLLLLLLLFHITTAQYSLTTTYAAGNGAGGNMFDVVNTAAQTVYITRFSIHVSATTAVTSTIYTKTGSYSGYTGNSAVWTQIHSQSVTGAGTGNPTALSTLQNIVTIAAGATRAFFVKCSNTQYTNGVTEGALYISDAYLSIYTGVGISSSWTTSPFTPRTWNGILYYSLSPPPTEFPTPSPTQKPTPSPTPSPTPAPTINPSPAPTTFPTKYPTKYPTISPTKYPTKYPTVSPSNNPSSTPTLTPSNNPTQFTINPTVSPTNDPTINPTFNPTLDPTKSPTLPEGGIDEHSTTMDEDERPQQITGGKANGLEGIFGSFWYIILIAIIIVILCCCVGIIIFWKKKKAKQNQNSMEGTICKPNPMVKIQSLSNIIGHTTKDIELMPLPPEETQTNISGVYDDEMTPMGFNVETPFGPHNGDNNVVRDMNTLTPGVGDMQKCKQCGNEDDGKNDTDGSFYCNKCWTEFINTNEDGENDELYNIKDNDDDDNDNVIQKQETMGNGSEEETPM